MRHLVNSLLRLSSISDAEPTPERANEDAYFIWGDGEQFTILVVDGASARANLKMKKMQQLIMAHDHRATVASYSSHLTRDTIATKILNKKQSSLRDLLLEANITLHNQLEGIYGELTADALLLAEPQLHFLKEDPRLIRLALPACVATITRVDLVAHCLEFAHVGDTALFLFYQDGQVERLTVDQMRPHDARVLDVARTIQKEKGYTHFSEALSDQQVMDMNRYNGIYHNYVDQNGQVDTKVGVGVIDGLPQLEAYIQEGCVDLRNVSGLLICSDGLIWPPGWNESTAGDLTRMQIMRQYIERFDLSGYITDLRKIEQDDITCELYPRLKMHDDATGIYLKLL